MYTEATCTNCGRAIYGRESEDGTTWQHIEPNAGHDACHHPEPGHEDDAGDRLAWTILNPPAAARP